MADLLSLLETAVARLSEQEQREEASQALLARVRQATHEQAAALRSEGQRVEQRQAALTAQLQALQQQMDQAAGSSQAVLSRALQALREHAQAMSQRQAQTRARLATLREQMGRAQAELSRWHQELQVELDRVTHESVESLALGAAAGQQLARWMAEELRPSVAAMQAQAAARGEGLQLFLHDQVLPDLESEHQGFSARLTRLGERLAEAVEKAQRALLGAGEARLESFRQESGSDFRGGPGDPEAAAAARAAEAVSRAEEQLQKLQLTQSGLANAGRTFSHSLTQVERHFEEIHELPRKLDAILKRVGI